MLSFQGKVAVITGASRGIGRAIALAWLAAGGEVFLLGRNRVQLEEVATESRKTSGRVHYLEVDLESEQDIRKACHQLEALPQLDLLVNCAGHVFYGQVADAPLAQLDRQYRVNLRAPYLLTQLLLPLLKVMGGQVVFVNSSAGLCARSHFSQYAATKHALKALADSLRQEVNSDGVRVLSIYPGRTATAMQKMVCSMEGSTYRPEELLQPEDVASAVMHAIGLPAGAEMTDVQLRPSRKN